VRQTHKVRSAFLTLMISMLPFILIIAVIWFLLFRQLRQSGGGAGMLGNFGRSRHRMMTKEHVNITFTDVAGIEEAKDEVFEIVEFLKNPKRFQRLGGRIPRGVLLVGQPGCGKTLLAKAIAGEADVPFFSISGSDFVEMFVGVGASRVRDLFRQAKENSPCIVFLDEIDAVGRRRGMGYSGGGHDEREQTLNAILVEMDGFESNDQVIVVAATNRADVLDPALIRPGRFDRQVFVPLPDVKGRFDILKVHARKIKMALPIEKKLHQLARATPMFSGADLAAIINEAALLGTLAGKDAVDLDDLEEARDKIRFGRAKRSRVVEDRDRELTAYHEAGHAVVQTVLDDTDPVHKVSIIPRGPYGGATFSLPEKDRMTMNRSFVESTLRVLCAGRIAEEMLGHDMNSGAEGDIKQATQLARHMITEWGMSNKLGFVHYGDGAEQGDFPSAKDFSDQTSNVIDDEIKRIITEAYDDCRKIIDEHRPALEAVAQALLKYETLTGDEVRQIVAGDTLDKPTVADLIEAEQKRREQEPPPVARPIEPPPDEETGGAIPHPA
jgi:cell division protease FtsH